MPFKTLHTHHSKQFHVGQSRHSAFQSSNSLMLSHYHQQNPLQDFFKFVKKNTIIPNFLQSISPHNTHAERLLTAIHLGNHKDDIFKDPYCYLFILHLIEKSNLNFWHGMTAYAYTLAIGQYSSDHVMHEKGRYDKVTRAVTVDFISKDHKLTRVGEDYLKYVVTRMEEQGYPLNYDELVSHILTLPPVEQWLVRVPYKRTPVFEADADPDLFLRILIMNIAFCSMHVSLDEPGFYDCRIPSSSVMQYILKKMSPEPMEMMPILGSVSLKMLYQLHRQNKHPVAFHGLHVKSNLIEANGLFYGPFLLWLHDIGHVFWASMLSAKERKMIYDYFIPAMQSLLSIANAHLDTDLADRINKIIDKVNDYDLTDIKNFRRQDRFFLYLIRALSEYDKFYPYSRVEFAKIGVPVEDRLYFLIAKMQCEMPGGEEKEFWKNVIDYIGIGSFYRLDSVVDAITHVAEVAANNYKESIYKNYKKPLIWNLNECRLWIEMTDPKKTSQEVWNNIFKNNREDQLVNLISHHQLVFFHPYYPLSDKMRNDFRNRIMNKIDELEKLNPYYDSTPVPEHRVKGPA